jgi:Lon protease-like protein
MDKIPLFPLNLVLFPGSHLPLRIFETRYIDLISECLRTESGFGVSLIMEGSEVGGGAKCHQLGTYARIVDWSQLEDGLLGITAKAERRFRINEFSERENTLLEGLVEWVEEDLVPENVKKYKVLQDLLTRVLSHFEIEYADLESKLNDPLWLGYRLAEFLPLEPRLKQELLEMTDYSERLARLQELLKDTDIA